MVAFLGGDQLQRRMFDATTIHDLGVLLELLASGAVETRVLGYEQIVGAALVDPLQKGDDAADMPALGGPNPVVVAAPQPPPVFGESGRHAVYPGLRADPPAGRGLDDRLAVLVHSHE